MFGMLKPSLLLVWILSCSRVAAVIKAEHPTGSPSCPCAEWADFGSNVVGGFLIVKPVGAERSYQYPSSYGQVQCVAHDYGLPPFCTGLNPAAWCEQPWCFVKSTCTGVVKMSTSYIGLGGVYSSAGIMWSFATCGQSNTYTRLTAESKTAVQSLLGVMESYLRSSRTIIESGYDSIVKGLAVNGSAASGGGVGGAVNAANRSSAVGCLYKDMCSCTGCKTNAHWNAKLDFESTGVWMKDSISGSTKNTFTCLAKGAANVFEKVASKESDPARTHAGYLYFSDQATGSYVQWPESNGQGMCGKNYDPRFRPWYAGAATGPKDIVIVVDVSGSMSRSGRDALARKAVKAIVNTLTWKDFATVVLFHNGIHALSSDLMKPMTPGNRAAMLQWIGDDSTCDWKSGGTNFITALTKAYEVIDASVKAKKTSMCQKLIMFLTDGVASFSESNYAFVKAQGIKHGTAMLTYALGSGADTATAKRLACDNKGIFYQIPDNSDLSAVMASYYEYIAAGQEVCMPSYIKYSDIGTGATLYGGCLPSYYRKDFARDILGVSCMDLNMLATPAELKQQAAWKHLVCKMSDQTKLCRPFYLDECQREKLRLKVGSSSVCGASTAAIPASKCGCFDRNCQDDMDFIDSQSYFCDVWVGDDCSEAHSKWGYTAAEETTIKAKCPRSCGMCPWQSTCTYTMAKDCLEQVQLPATCRACNGVVSGADIEGNPAKNGCSDPKSTRYVASGSGGVLAVRDIVNPSCQIYQTTSDDGGGGGIDGMIIGIVAAILVPGLS